MTRDDTMGDLVRQVAVARAAAILAAAIVAAVLAIDLDPQKAALQSTQTEVGVHQRLIEEHRQLLAQNERLLLEQQRVLAALRSPRPIVP